MKIAVLSDTHLYQVTDEFQTVFDRYCNGVDLVIHLGDFVKHSILAFLEQHPLEAVAGNMDDAYIQERLPSRKIIKAEGCRIALIHGWGPAYDLRDRLRSEFSGVDAVLFGHTHQALELVENGVLWFNPGSVFTGRGVHPRSMGLLHIQDRSIRGEIVPL
jgi:uncharacterized protein